MSKITYTDKVALNENPNVADINKVRANDLNEIKNVVNANDDDLNEINDKLTNLQNIAESGDGYIKYSDGTMICYGSSSGTSTTSHFYQYLYRLAENLIINFPATFSEIPVVTLTPDYTNGIFACPTNEITVSQIKFTPIKATNSGNSYTVHYIAIGKWK